MPPARRAPAALGPPAWSHRASSAFTSRPARRDYPCTNERSSSRATSTRRPRRHRIHARERKHRNRPQPPPQRTRRNSLSRLRSDCSFLAQRESAIGRRDLKAHPRRHNVEYRAGSRAGLSPWTMASPPPRQQEGPAKRYYDQPGCEHEPQSRRLRPAGETAAMPLEQARGRCPSHRSDGRQRGAPCSPPVTAAFTKYGASRPCR
jgi:hypothetical protein